MRIAGVDETSLIQIGVPDQDAARHIADIARVLAGVIAAKGIGCATWDLTLWDARTYLMRKS